jgi:D-alanyl-D-alanine carboxypeptidase
MKKLIYILILMTWMSIFSVPVSAETTTKEQKSSVSIVGESAIVTDLESGDVLYEKNADVERYPASITKIMTALVVLENRDLSDEITYSEEALNSIESGSSAAYIKPGEVLTIEESLYVMMLHSANDVAHGLAYEVGGNLEGFAQMMNEKAVQLGCQKTHFVNASGLTDKNHYTTAQDMSKIAKAAYENAQLREIMGTVKYELPATNKYESSRTWINGNRMIREGTKYYYEACLGGKTGYTIAAGGTLVTYAKIEDRILSCVILKSQNSASAYEDSIKLYNYVKENIDFSVYKATEETTTTEAVEEEEESTEIENIIYQTPKTTLQKVFFGIKIAGILFVVLCVGVILRIIYVQYKRRQMRKRRRRKAKRKRR